MLSRASSLGARAGAGAGAAAPRLAIAPGQGGALQSRGMAENLKTIQMRIQSTNNIRKITKSMKMVSAAKLKGDTFRLMEGRPFGATSAKIFDMSPGEEDTPLPEFKNPLYVIISSDRGLCGGVNSFVSKHVKLAVDKDVANGLNPKIFVIGDKGHAMLARTHADKLLCQINESSKTPMNFNKACIITDRIIAAAPDADVVKICYNRFISAINYETGFKSTVNFPAAAKGVDGEGVEEMPYPLYKYEGEMESAEEATKNLYEYGLAVQLYGSLIESATSEQSARMTAMDGASKNAGEMVDKLTVKYNRARQAKITTELIEIISGAESLKN